MLPLERHLFGRRRDLPVWALKSWQLRGEMGLVGVPCTPRMTRLCVRISSE